MKKAEIIMTGNQKGGAGKSTLCICLSAALTALGYKCCLIDTDPEGHMTNNLLAEDPQYILFDVLRMNCDIKDAVVHTAVGDLIPTSEKKLTSESAQKGMYAKRETRSLYRLIDDMEKDPDGDKWLASVIYQMGLRDMYDFIIIDTPPSADKMLNNAFVACHSIMIPCEVDPDSMNGLNNLLNSFAPLFALRNTICKNNDLNDFTAEVSFDGIAMTKFSDKTGNERKTFQNIQQFAEVNGLYMYSTKFRQSKASLLASKNEHRSILDYMYMGSAASDSMNFALEFLHKRGLQPKVNYPGVFNCETGNLIFRPNGAEYYKYVIGPNGAAETQKLYFKARLLDDPAFMEEIGKTVFFFRENLEEHLKCTGLAEALDTEQ